MYKHNNKTLFRKITDVIHGSRINRIAKKYNADYKTHSFYTDSHVYSMIYLNLSNTKTLRGLADKLQYSPKLQSIINPVSVSQLSRQNAKRDYRVFEDLFYETLSIAKTSLGAFKASQYFREIKAIDSTLIQVASKLAPLLDYENNKAAVKISSLLNVSNGLPEKIELVTAKTNDRKCIKDFINDKETLYLFDRGYYDYGWYDKLTDQGYSFITRQTSNACVAELRSSYVDDDLIFDYEITLGTEYSKNKTHNKYREILTFDEKQEEIRILTNIFDISAKEILDLYRLRWRIEIFFKWIKQNLRIKEWLGYNENAIKIQIYSALITYILLLLLNLKLESKHLSVLQISRIVQVNIFEEYDMALIFSG